MKEEQEKEAQRDSSRKKTRSPERDTPMMGWGISVMRCKKSHARIPHHIHIHIQGVF